jgi:hypothetical protein
VEVINPPIAASPSLEATFFKLAPKDSDYSHRRFFNPTSEQIVAFDENNLGAAYLAALKQTRPDAAGSASQAPQHVAAIASPVNPASAHPSEKRRSTRYKCQGSAHLHERGTGVATWATFTDISLNGCYVEAASTFRVEAQLDITLEINGFRLETRAEVRVAYPGLGMGIAFKSMSDADQERLWDLLRSISRPGPIPFQRIGTTTAEALQSNNAPAPPDPTFALKAITDFFDQRQMLSREEFHRILRYLPKQST